MRALTIPLIWPEWDCPSHCSFRSLIFSTVGGTALISVPALNFMKSHQIWGTLEGGAWEAREDAECGANAFNKDTFGDDADSRGQNSGSKIF